LNELKKEMQVGESRFCYDEDDILYIEIAGEYNEQNALAIRDAFLEMLGMAKKNDEGKIKILVNSNAAKKPTPEARKMFSKLMEDESVGKIAIYGSNPVIRVIASFVIGFSKNKNIKIFNSKEDALAWFKE